VATVAAAAEQAGWDALFVWDHVVHDKGKRRGQPFGDPWMLLTAAALATSDLRLAGHGHVPPVDQVRDLIAYIRKHRTGRAETPFEIVLGGASPADPAEARDTIAALADAGATWWDERQLQRSDDLYRQMPVLRRINKGPPSL
jgi:hypothetical protein